MEAGIPVVDDERLSHLAARVRGELIRPGDAGYDEARRVYNGMHDRRPALIVRARDAGDVIATVELARETGALLAVRGGGHSVPGYGTCEGGIVLDLSRMKGVHIDPARRTARVEPGCTWGDLNHAAHAFGLATTGGIVSTTGVAGLTLGGGLGFLARRFGLACDNLIGADVVLADGRFVTARAGADEDLLWALRGGGGNFGVVTSFEFSLHPVGEIIGGPTFFPVDADVVRAYRDWLAGAPEELGALCGITRAPPAPFVPKEWHGQPVIAVLSCWTGERSAADAVLAPLRSFGPLVGARVGPMPYPAINALFDEIQLAGGYNYWKGGMVRALDDDCADVLAEHARGCPSQETATILFPLDGAVQRRSSDDAAWAFRDVSFAVVISGHWPDAADNEHNIGWVRSTYGALRPWFEEGGYVNFLDHDDAARVSASYRDGYRRLVELKRRYDPGNLFRLNQNIPPEE